MTIEDSLSLIKDYHKTLGYDYKYPSVEAQMEHFRSLVLAQVGETIETLNETPWKPWRNTEDQAFDHAAAAEEIVDQFFFMAAQWFCLGFTPEMFENIFVAKLQENLARIERGYNKTAETQGERSL